ncbi:hypothetical protein ACFFX0_02670 [Citricoccus parietis]|uniref:Uncharacterized protein n=1 Tax=Citricoccus parietis TaxID=592307 RepID=A0ABV5FV48_9MICC
MAGGILPTSCRPRIMGDNHLGPPASDRVHHGGSGRSRASGAPHAALHRC